MEHFITDFTAILVRQGSLAAKEAYRVIEEFEGRSQDALIDFLLEEGLVAKEDILKALSAYYQVPAFDVTGYLFDHNLVHSFPKDLLTSCVMIPADVENDILTMIIDDPTKEEVIARTTEYSDAEVEFCVGIKQDIYDAIEEFSSKSLTAEDEDELIDESADVVDTDAV